jgi:amino acid adenylation domain-containing protein/non-ribosomal peptide synthase protein (TIGR01720 family)
MTAEATRVAALSTAKRELLRRRLSGAAATVRDGIPPRPQGPVPMAPVQHAMWVTNQLLATNALYNVPRILHIRAPLDVGALQNALDALVERHEILRTSYPDGGGQSSPVPVIAPDTRIRIRQADLRAAPAGQRWAEAMRLAQAEASTPFDLARGPAIRVLLIRLGQDSHVLALTQHHIVTDGWSCTLLLRDLDELYSAAREDRPPALADLPVQYADYAAWQAGRLAGGLEKRQLDYWQTALEATPEVLELPTDKPRPSAESHRGATIDVTVSPELSERVRALAAEHHVTVYTVLLSALAVVLRQLSGQTRFAVGSVLSGRDSVQTEAVLGLFINAVALPMDVSGGPSFAEVLRRTQATVLAAFENGDVTFDQVVRAVRASRSAAGNPVYQVLYQCFEERERVTELPGLQARTIDPAEATAKVDLTVNAFNGPAEITLSVNYATDLFAPPTIRRLAGYLITVLEHAVGQPDRVVRADMMIGPEERDLLLGSWASSGRPDPGPPAETVVGLFRRQAATTPTAPAVLDDQARLSYAELDLLTDRIARGLRARGVRRGDVVGIGLPRGAAMVAAALGILKAAAGYLSLDPSLPAARINLLLADAMARLIITEGGGGPAGFASAGFADLAACGDDNGELPAVAVSDLAYVVYTSGSSGRPKGIETQHGAVTNLLAGAAEEIPTRPGDRWLLLSSLGFDGSTQELFLPLTRGAAVVVASDEARLDGAELSALIRRSAVTHAQGTPAGWQLLLAGGFDGPLKYAVNTAETLPPAVADQLRARSGQLINGYGPTEITVHATHAHLAEGKDTTDIGRPIRGYRVYVLDASLEPVPRGALGELYIAGYGLARGYRGSPGLTARAFRPDPFGPPGSRMYRTGDLVRFADDGSLRIRGRADHLVKIRSHSVEPAEIENQLLAHPEVARAAVIAVDTPAGRRLAGYVVAANPGARTDAAGLTRRLRRHLTGTLPGYLVPSRILLIDQMPLTDNGKLDRRALPRTADPAPDEIATESTRTPEESVLVDVWRTVLGLAAVGIQDNFFDLGGDSIAAIHVAAAASAAGLSVTPRQVLTQQTLADLAAAARETGKAVPAAEPTEFDVTALRQAGIDTTAITSAYPLSPMQAGMLFHTLFHPDATDYLVQFVYALDGAVDATLLRRALELVIARHDALRTTFAWDALTEPVQLVHRSAPVSLRELDWHGTAEAAVAGQLARHLAAERSLGIDLERTPPRRFDLIRLPAGRHLLVWHGHHILLDGWSVRTVLDEVRAVHDSLRRTGAPPPLPAPVPFGPYIAWLRRRDPAAAGQYWRDVLADVTDPTPLPILAPPAAAGRARAEAEPDQLAVQVDAETTELVRNRARSLRITAGSMVHAAWALVLRRYSGRPDVVFGSTTSGRSGGPAGVERTVGMLVNTLPVRVRTSPGDLVSWWLRGIHDQLVSLRDFEHCALVDVQRQSKVPPGRRLFDTILMFEGQGRGAPAGAGAGGDGEPGTITMAARQTWEETGYPLVLNASLHERLLLRLDYHPAQIEPAIARLLLEHFKAALRDLAAAPDTARLADLPPLPPAEWRSAVADFNATAARYPASRCLHELFEDQADRTPAAVAVRFGTDGLSYRELDERANRLAHELRDLGVGAESLVALFVRRGIDMAVAVLGVLKAGAAYVPLDPEYPADRIEFMLADAAAPVVVTQTAVRALLPGFDGRTVCLDEAADAARIAGRDSRRPARGALPGNLAYVIYTSGSTGRPKGTLIRHEGIVNYVWWMVTRFPLGEGDKILQLAGLSFDISVYEMFWPWASGATVVLARPDGYRDPQYIIDAMAAGQITAAHLVPSMVRALLPLLDGVRLPLRWLFASAEAMTPDLVARWHEHCPGTALLNLYGATEVSVDSTIWPCDPAAALVSVGAPIANTRLYLLDETGEPVPTGVPGEAYLGGASVGRGYHRRPGLTARRFVPDPFGPPGSRLYRTGDLLRRLPDGTVEFLGRLDHQVKVRGFRVEMEEVEAALLAHPGVAHAAVTASRDPAGPARLIGYVAARGDTAPTVSALRTHLAGRLPDYMVPAVFVMLPALPLNPNGKVDRAALPAPGTTRPSLADPFEPPRSPAEKTLAGIWCQVLGVHDVGIHDDFFDLGGDSILSIQVMTEARRAGVALIPRQVFEHRTIAELAAAATGMTAPTPVHAEQGPVTGEVPLTPIQHWFMALDWPVSHYNQSVRLRWDQPVDPAALRAALSGLLAHHDALRLRLTGSPGGGWRQQITSQEGTDVLRSLNVTDTGPGQVAAVVNDAADELQAGLDVRTGPLLRALLVRYEAGRHDEVIITAHHLAVDAISWGILLSDLAAGYEQARRGEPVTLPAKTTSFRYWSRRLSEHARSEAFADEVAYWNLPGRRPASFPCDHRAGTNTQGSSALVVRELDPARTDALLRSAHAAYRTQVNDLLVTALAQVLAGHTGGTDVHIDLEGHGREPLFDDIDLSRTVGWFTSIHPLHLRLPDPENKRRSLLSVKEHLRGTPDHGIGYGLARYLARDPLPETPAAPVSFNYLGQRHSTAEEGLFARLDSVPGTDRAPSGIRPHLIEVNAAVVDGIFRVVWTYSANIHRAETVEALADDFTGRLSALLDHCAVARNSPRELPDRDILDRLSPGIPATRLRLRRHRVPGASIAMVADGELAGAWGEGWTSATSGAPVRPDTVFQAGSVSKHVTAVAVQRLAADGIVNLDEDVNRYLRRWRLPRLAPARPVSLRSLMAHTAGLTADEFGGLGACHPGRPLPDLLDVLAGRLPAATAPVRPEAPPGERFRYSGNNFVVVEEVIQEVTGTPFAELMRTLVFEPLDMPDSGYGQAFAASRDDRVAWGHDTAGQPIAGRWRVYPAATGGLWTTACDLARIAAEVQRALAGGGSVLDRDGAGALLTPTSGASYGLGTVTRLADGVHWFGHTGASAGYRCYSGTGIEPGVGVVIMTNGDAGSDLTMDLLAELGLGFHAWAEQG